MHILKGIHCAPGDLFGLVLLQASILQHRSQHLVCGFHHCVDDGDRFDFRRSGIQHTDQIRMPKLLDSLPGLELPGSFIGFQRNHLKNAGDRFLSN